MRLFQGLQGVKPSDLPTEILAGVTLATLVIPLNIGYAQVAGLSPTAGLYAAILPLIVYAIFCTSRQVVASPNAVNAALLASSLTPLAAPGEPRYVQLAYAETLLVALLLFLFWFFRLGLLTNFFSKAVLEGFIMGIEIEVLTSQIKKIMGISVNAEGWFPQMFELITRISDTNWYSVAIGIGTIAIVQLLQRLAPRIPATLVALLVMTGVVTGLRLEQQGVKVLGEIPAGLPTLTIPQVNAGDFASLLPAAVAIAGVTLTEGLLLGRRYAHKRGYEVDFDQEIFAFGVSNLAAGVTGGFALGASASRTGAMDNSGSRSQIPSIVGAIIVAIVVLFFTKPLALLPEAVVAGVVTSVVLRLFDVEELHELFRVRRSEFWIAIACLFSVLLLGPLKGVLVAFLLSMLDLLHRAAHPPTAVLAGAPGSDRFVSASRYPEASQIPGLLIYRFGAPLIFPNAEFFRKQIVDLVETSEPSVQWFVLDAEAISDIDVTGSEALKEVLEWLEHRHVHFAMTRVSQPVYQLLQTYELLHSIGENQIYSTNREVARAFQQKTIDPTI